jgi:pilus assembly protein Flp/PilA
MAKLVRVLNKIRKDEDGATLVEYTMLLAIIVVAVIGTLTTVGSWVNNQWLTLCKALNAGC